MSGPRRDFKEWLAQQAAADRSEASSQQVIDAWTGEVSSLFNQVERWLDQDDPQQVLRRRASRIARHEQDLGRYEAPALSVSLRNRTVDLIPIARNVVGAVGARGNLGIRIEGRVDMTNGADKYMLYRAVYPAGPKWVIVDDDTYTVRDLDKETFEEVLQALLS